MSQSTPPLQQHLLTRSDLAQMAVPAAHVLSWLANGWLEEVGRVPPGDDRGEPVFTVSSVPLQQELAARLRELGKPDVVMTPLRVRSFLMRTMLHDVAADRSTAGPDSSTVTEWDDLGRMLFEAASDFEADLEVMQEMAREEARLEATELQAHDMDAHETQREGEREPPDCADEEHAAMDAECFDFEDLTSALDHLDGTSSRSSAADDAEPVVADPVDEPVPETLAPILATPAEANEVELPDEEPLVQETPAAPSEEAIAAEADSIADEPPIEAPAEPQEDEPESVEPESVAMDPLEPEPVALEPVAMIESEPAEVEPTVPEAPVAGATPAAAAQAVMQTVTAEATEKAMHRVESFLSQLKEALVQLAQRPEARPSDMSPLIAAFQSGLDRSNDQCAAQTAALQSLNDRLGNLGERMEHGVSSGVSLAIESALIRNAGSSGTTSPAYVLPRSDRTSTALLAVMLLVMGWAVVFWFKTDSGALALSTLIGANVIGCCLLVARRSNS